MNPPRDIDAQTLIEALGKLGYRMARQTDNHLRLTCTTTATHSVTVPDHAPIQPATLDAILAAIAPWHRMDAAELAGKLFD